MTTAEASSTLSRHMHLAKLVAACGLIAVALVVSACGIQAKPVAGTIHLNRSPGNHSRVTDPRTTYVHCLRGKGFAVHEFTTGPGQLRSIQVDSRPNGPTIVFEPTTGIAEGDQIEGRETGAEVLGDALIYPNRTPDDTMATVEGCLSIGVTG